MAGELLDVVMFRDGGRASPARPSICLFSGEKTRPGDLLPAPEIQTVDDPASFRVITLESLVVVKLVANRDKDRTVRS